MLRSGNWCLQRSRDRPLRSRYGRSRNSPRCTNGSEDRRSSAPAAMETILAAYWKTSPRAAITEDDACALRANSDGLGSQAKYWRLIMQYGKRSEEHTSELQSLMRISYAVFCL